MIDPVEACEELDNLREQMFEALEQATAIVNQFPGARDRAEAYWIAHIKSALGGVEYDTHATTMLDTMTEIGGE